MATQQTRVYTDFSITGLTIKVVNSAGQIVDCAMTSNPATFSIDADDAPTQNC